MNLKKIISLIVVIFSLISAQRTQANVLGTMQTFSPVPDSILFETVESSQTLKKNWFNVGLYASYLKNELTAYDNIVNYNYQNYKDSAFEYDLFAAWGVTDHLELFYSQPGLITQSPDSGQSEQHYLSKGASSNRLGVKYDISQDKTGGLAVDASIDFPHTNDDPYTGSPSAPIYNAELIYDWIQADSAYAVNLGYTKRAPGDPADGLASYYPPLKDQLTFSAAAAFALRKTLHYQMELFGVLPVDKSPQPSATHASSLEILLGLKQQIIPDLWAHVGFTLEALSGGLSPEYRIYAGLNWTFGLPAQAHSEPAPEPAREVNPDETTAETPVETADLTTPSSLAILPSSVQLYEGAKQKFTVESGDLVESHLVKEFGQWDSETMTYIAPGTPGHVRLVFVDAQKQRVTVPITVLAIPKADREITLKNLEFVTGTGKLTPAGRKILDKTLNSLKGLKPEKIIVIGHTDSTGSMKVNQELSLYRANVIGDALAKSLKMNRSKIQGIGMGPKKPIAPNSTKEGRQKNRRAEIKLYFKKT